MSTALVGLHAAETPWVQHDEPIVIGKDILEVLSSAMYVDPLAVYREYVQNAADAIDEARHVGLLTQTVAGTVEIEIDAAKRTVLIRDNGIGIPAAEFALKMTAFGSSAKRGTNARGFRGVGRLSGIAYCQELLFRSRSAGESDVSELRWDCRKTKGLLRSADFPGALTDVVSRSVQIRRTDGKKQPNHFFEVELRGVPRLRNDWLLNPAVIEDYLSQIAPLPFVPQFRFADEISALLREHVRLTDITLKVGRNSGPTFRPHRDFFEISGGQDKFHELQTIRIPGLDGGTAAVGWVLHHGYRGAIPSPSLKGLRLRSGNVQIGTSGILEDLFVEVRFNSWCVGEVHVVDARIIPNGRRDHYEQNVHYTNLVNQLSPLAKDISAKCRRSSIRRNCLRLVERQREQVGRDMKIIKQGSLTGTDRQVFTNQIQQALDTMEIELSKAALKFDAPTLLPVLAKLRRDFSKIQSAKYRPKVLSNLSPVQRRAYEQAFALVYECFPDKSDAKVLIDRMLARLARNLKASRSKRKTSD
jgi:Histidine kinase-, DNA gyrase B-, and HSP90-like ATPase